MLIALNLKRTHLRALLVTAGVQDTRYYLNGVYIELHSGTAFMVSTDGHRLGVIRCDMPELTLDKPVQFIVPRELLKRIKRPARGLLAFVGVTFDTDTQAVSVIDGAATVNGKAIDGRFPDWQRVLPHSVNGKAAQFNAAYLGDLAKIAAELGDTSFPTGTVHHNGDGAALVTVPGHPEYLGVLMPLRFRDDESQPTPPDVLAFKRTAKPGTAKAAAQPEAVAA